MFKKLFNKFMPNKEVKDDIIPVETTAGVFSSTEDTDSQDSVSSEVKNDVASDPRGSAGTESPEAPVETSTPKDQVPGVEVPAGHQVPGTNMSDEDLSQSDSAQNDGTSEDPIIETEFDEPAVDKTETKTVSINETNIDPMIPVGPN